MKRSSKATFFVTLCLILTLAATTFIGIHTYKGDFKNTIIKGAGDIRWGIDIRGGVETVFTPGNEVDINKVTKNQMKAAETVIVKRLIGANITDYEIYPDFDEKQIIVRFPWKSDEKDFDPSAAIKEIGATAHLTFCEGTDQSKVIIEGKHIVSATPGQNQTASGIEPVVSFKLNSEGAKKFAEATERLAKSGTISIWLDGKMISNPNVNEKIPNGEGQISGVSQKEADSLSNQLNAGALPFSLKTNDSRTQIISPTLGETALDTMVLAGLIAFVLISIFLIIMYRLPGVIAIFALTGEISLTLAAISGYFSFIPSFTLTIPGLAGIVLSIGMGVDANIIATERIRDELRMGKTIDGSIKAGFSNSFSAIFDGNITVIIVALILMGAFGPPDSLLAMGLSKIMFMFPSTLSGPVYSFGYTLLIGVICNFIMGVTASRMMLRGISQFKFLRKPSLYNFGGKK